jgi:predicted esterase
MQNFKSFFLFLLFLCFFKIEARPLQPNIKDINQLNALTIRKITDRPPRLALYTIEELIRTIHKDDAIPKRTLLSINNHYFMVYRGIELYDTDKKVFIFSRGYAKTTEPGTNDDFIQRGAAAKAAHIQFNDHIVPDDYPLICFDYDDGRYGFAFGQQREIESLKAVYHAVLEKNNHADIILMGDCRGAKVALEVAIKRPKNLRALILMAPFVSGRDLTNNIAMHHLKYLPLHKEILHRFFKAYFKNYRQSLDTLEHRLYRINPHIPIFIGHRIHDQLVSNESIQTLIDTLESSGNPHVHLVTSEDQSEPHSKLTEIPEIQQGVAQFMDMHKLLD